MALTSDQLKANATAMKTQGASDVQVQSYLDGFKQPSIVPDSVNASSQGFFSHLMNAGGDLMKGNVVGAVGNLGGAAYEGTKDIVQGTGINRFMAMAPQAINQISGMVTGDYSAAKSGESGGYNMGDFFGTAKPLSPVDITKSPIDNANIRSLADTAGTTLNTESYMLGGGAAKKIGVEAGVATADAAKGLVAKGVDYLKGSAKGDIGKFSVMQGGSAGLQAYGQGESAGSATMTGVAATAVTAAFMKFGDVTGGWLKGNFWTEAQKTGATQFFQKQLSGVAETLQKMLPEGKVQNIADTLGSTYDMLQHKTNTALTGLLSGIRKTVNNPTNEEWIRAYSSHIADGFRKIQQQNAEGFDGRVFGGNTIIKTDSVSASEFRTSYENAIKKATSAQELDVGTGSGAATSLGQGLGDFLGVIRRNFLEPGSFNIKAFSNVLDFVEINGTGAEIAIANDVKGALYRTVESQLSPQKLAAWTKYKNAATNLANKKNAEFVKLFPSMNSPMTLANNFLKGSVLGDAAQTKEMESMIGADGVAALKGTLIHTAIGNAIDQFGKKVISGVDSSYTDARKAASDELQKYIDLVAGARMGYRPLSAPQTQMLKDAQAIIMGSDVKTMAEMWGKVAPDVAKQGERATAMMDVTTRAKQAYDASRKSASALSGEIIKMTDKKDVSSLLSLVGSQENRTLVGMGVMKDMLTKFGNTFTTTGPEEWGKTIKELGSIGGPDRQAIFEELFGKSPETKALVDGIDTAVKALEAFSKSPNSGAMGRAGNAMLGIGFLMAHHPIISTGFLTKAMKGSKNEAENVFQKFFGKSEAEFQAMMEKDNKVSVTGVKSVVRQIIRKLGTVLQSRAGQYTIGAGASAGVQSASEAMTGTSDTITPIDTNP